MSRSRMTQDRHRRLCTIRRTQNCGSVWGELGECLDEIEDLWADVEALRGERNRLMNQVDDGGIIEHMED